MTDLVPKSLAVKMDAWKRDAKAWRPWPYQERALKFMLENGQCGLLLDPGMGKTSVTLAAMKLLLRRKCVRRVLVVAPLRPVYDVWPREICDWEDFHSLGLAILHGDKKDRILRTLGPEHKIVLINPEGFQWLTSSKDKIKALDADALIVDESSKFKESTTVRFKALRKVIHLFPRRHILTGSPRPKNYLDLFGQVFIMDRGATLGQYVSHFRNQYFYPTGYLGYDWAPLPGTAEKLSQLIAPMVLRLDAADYLKLPQIPKDALHAVDLPLAVQREYDAVEESLMSTIFDAPMTHAAAARTKCCQMANGAVYLDMPAEDNFRGTRPVKFLHTAKVDALQDLVDELQGEPLLVSIGFHHDVQAIRRALGDVPCINAYTTRTQAAKYIDDWNAGKLSVLLGHPGSMGHGLNMQGCNCRHVAFFDIPDNYDYYDQFFRRVWRQGNKSQFVMRHHFVARNTVDVAKMKNMKDKGNGQASFLKAMKEYAQERGHVVRRGGGR